MKNLIIHHLHKITQFFFFLILPLQNRWHNYCNWPLTYFCCNNTEQLKHTEMKYPLEISVFLIFQDPQPRSRLTNKP